MNGRGPRRSRGRDEPEGRRWKNILYYSMIHVDFMIGTKDLEIVGTSFSGEKTVIFKDGNWAI